MDMTEGRALDLMSITELEGLGQHVASVIVKKKAEKARKDGRSFARLEDIPAPEGHVHEFASKPIGDFSHVVKGIKPEIYVCKGCLIKVYTCPTCGVVPGIPEGREYSRRAGFERTRGKEYHCVICEEEIGESVFR